jgi:predicted Zn finger-like uncharacterized protein
MPVSVECPSCQHGFMVPDNRSGRPVKCPRCERGFDAPISAVAVPLALESSLSPAIPRTLAMGLSASQIPVPASDAFAPALAPAPVKRRLTQLVFDFPDAVVRNVPKPLQGITGLAAVGLAVGLVAWAVLGLFHQETVSFALATIGLLLGGVATAALVKSKERGLGLPIAALAVNLQALVMAMLVAFAPEPKELDFPIAPVQAHQSPVSQLRLALKDPDSKERQHAAFAVRDLARDLNKAVLDLIALLRDPERTVRAASAEALGLIGLQARLAYPALADVNRNDRDAIVREKARDALKKIGPPTAADVAAEVEMLADKKAPKPARAAAAQCLALVGSDALVAVPALEVALRDADPSIRVSAAEALWALVGKEADGVIDAFTTGLRDFDPSVRALAAQGLVAMRADARNASAILESALGDSDPMVRTQAAIALWAIGPPAKASVGRLLEALRDTETKVRIYAAMGLWSVARQQDGIPVLCEILQDRDPLIRQMAVKCLNTICEEAKTGQVSFVEKEKRPVAASITSAVPPLTEALKDSDADVRGLAARTLGTIGQDAKAAVPVLVKSLKNADPRFRVDAAYALMEIGEPTGDAIRALRDALNDRDGTVQVFAAQALFSLERMPDSVVPALIKVMQDRDGTVRARAAFALGTVKTANQGALAALNEALKDPNASLRFAAAGALAKIGPAARVTYPTLDTLAKDDQPQVKKAAADAMKKIGPPQKADVYPLLIPALKHASPSYRAAAAVCLWMLFRDAREAVDPLTALLTDPDENVRGAAVFALAAIGKDASAAVPALVVALKNPHDDKLRFRAAYALGEIGPTAKAALPALHEALADKKPAVRLYAAQALWAVDPRAEDIVPALAQLLDEKELESTLLVAAIETLIKIGPKSAGDAKLAELIRTQAVPALTRTLSAPDESLQLTAINALGSIGLEGRAGIPRLIDMLAEADAQMRAAAIDALVQIGMAEREAKVSVRARTAFAALAFLSKFDSNQQVARAANLAMLKLGPPDAGDVSDLVSIADDNRQPLAFRNAAAQVLGLVGPEGKGQVDKICKLLTSDAPSVRALAAGGLAGMGPDGKSAIASLIQTLKDEEPYVRAAAVQALGDLGTYYRPAVEPALREVFQNAGEQDAVRAAAGEALKRLGARK